MMTSESKWKEIYDGFSDQYKATLTFEQYMAMPEVVRENLVPLTYDELKKEYPDVEYGDGEISELESIYGN